MAPRLKLSSSLLTVQWVGATIEEHPGKQLLASQTNLQIHNMSHIFLKNPGGLPPVSSFASLAWECTSAIPVWSCPQQISGYGGHRGLIWALFGGVGMCGHDCKTWGRGWRTKASGVGERRKGRGELRRDCHHRVAALFVPTRMQQWYMIYDI